MAAPRTDALLVAGNWKMNGTRALARDLALGAMAAAREARGVEVALFPPDALLGVVAAVLEGEPGLVALGGQRCHGEPDGAHTGSASAAILAEAGCRYALCGHSEARRELGDDDARVRAAARTAAGAGLVPIVCVGETREERDAGRAREVVVAQVDAVLSEPPPAGAFEPVWAYEPVWAIGTGHQASPEQAAEAHGWVRERLGAAGRRSRILYGGSVAPANIEGFLSQPGVDGVLVGGMSLKVPSFQALVKAALAAAPTRRRP